jgi:hypothetical protein
MSVEIEEKQPGESEVYVDVLIVMDITGSMQSWINSARDTVLGAFDTIQKQYPNSHIRLGLVCYRDIGDDERYVLHPLTENISDVQRVLKEVVAKGGDDAAEDVAGALENVLEIFREPRPSISPIRTVLFVTDAPAHGLRYHHITVADRFPKGDPDGREPYDQIRELAEMDVDMTVFRVNSTVDKMIEEFEMAYKNTEGTLTVLDVTKQCSPFLRSLDVSYADDTVFRGGRGDVRDGRDVRDDTFRMAACTSVTNSVEKRRDRSRTTSSS